MSHNDIIEAKHDKLRTRFFEIHLKSGAPASAALFKAINRGPERNYYFSPGAGAIAMELITEFGGIESAAPKQTDIGVVVGTRQHAHFAPETKE